VGETPTLAARLAVLGRRVVALDEEKERLDVLLTELVTRQHPSCSSGELFRPLDRQAGATVDRGRLCDRLRDPVTGLAVTRP
jgi:hypothetical protein